ncbi:expressed unknown protein [Seminavis robusta]|uniref:Uncharacterized protein n=1 Tax=Seminavis robusta TaxID=568900 RepID=A0A9N8DFQ2_9STRA|nr:expressed unknown protein [Seminavis robusta]|eukprot:Sro128_g061200.1 n/a (752) ;mRNA; r:50111-52366
MLSWVSDSIHKTQQHKPPLWYESEIRFGLCDRQQRKDKKGAPKRQNASNGLIPKLVRRAFEAATHNNTGHNGSFPTPEAPLRPIDVAEETAFEACDSVSLSGQSQTSLSCHTNLSYNMSRIDEDDGATSTINPELSFADSMLPSPSNSEADSLFGIPIREMAQADANQEKDRDDVWLLSTKGTDDIEASLQQHGHDVKSPTGSILNRVPVLVVPGTDRQESSDNPLVAIIWAGDSNVEDEEEIQFGDNSFLIEDLQAPLSSPTARCIRDFDENRNNGNITTRFTFGRKSAQLIGRNLKDLMWSHSNDGKRRGGKGHSRKSQATRLSGHRKKRKQPSPRQSSRIRLHCEDPLQELSRCHEKMSAGGRPFSPKNALNRVRDWKRRDPDSSSTSPCGECSSKYVLHPLDSMQSELSTPSALSSPRILNTFSEITASEKNDDDDQHTSTRIQNTFSEITASEKDDDDQQTRSDLSSPSIENSSLSITSTQKSKEWELAVAPTTTSTGTFKIKFRSPRNDTPRIMLGDKNDAEASDEPRVLYSSEGNVEAIIHPKEPVRQEEAPPQAQAQPEQEHEHEHEQPLIQDGHLCFRGFFPSADPLNSSLNHVFHSELSTLYEVSSSLESASFGNYSSAGSEESASKCAAHDPARLRTMSSSTSSDSTSKHYLAHQNHIVGKDASSTTAVAHVDGAEDTRSSSSVSGATLDRYYTDDCEVKMRWEYSLGMAVSMDAADQWRQPVMGLMNTEELSNDYIAEI